MPNPKTRHSKQRKRKRRTHYKDTPVAVSICKETGAAIRWHRAYEHEGALYYKGKVLVAAKGV